MEPRGIIVVEEGAASWPGHDRGRVPALEDVGNRPILEHVLDGFSAAGVGEVVVVSPSAVAGRVQAHLSESESRAGLTIRRVELEGSSDLGDVLRLAAPIVGDAPCIVHRASGLLDDSLSRFVTRLRDVPDVIFVVHQAASPSEHLSPATQQMLHLADFDADHALGMAGVWLFGPGALPIVAASPWDAADDLALAMLGRRIAPAGGGVQVELAASWHQYRGDPGDLLELNRIVLDRLDRDVCRPARNGNRIEGRVWIHEAASVRASVIVGPAVIGPGAQIHDAYIGPYTSIGERARVEGAEVERSIISAGASVMHVGSRIVASVVGRDARVFRDFSLPRAFRLRVGDGTEVALC